MNSTSPSAAARFWSTRHETAGALWSAGYHEAIHQPHRRVLVRALDAIEPRFDSVLELGSNAGPNIRLIRDAFPWTTVTGYDINPDAVAYARRAFAADPMVEVRLGTFEQALASPRRFDVVLSCYALAYVEPLALTWVLALVLSRARRAVVIAEPMVGEHAPSMKVAEIPEWAHNYVERVAALGAPWTPTLRWAIEPPADRLNALLVFTPQEVAL